MRTHLREWRDLGFGQTGDEGWVGRRGTGGGGGGVEGHPKYERREMSQGGLSGPELWNEGD